MKYTQDQLQGMAETALAAKDDPDDLRWSALVFELRRVTGLSVEVITLNIELISHGILVRAYA